VSKTDDLWWSKRDDWIEAHYIEHPHIDKYVVTVQIETSFARENDGVHNVQQAREWLRHGCILETAEDLKILNVRKGRLKRSRSRT